MDRQRFSRIAHGTHIFYNPLSEAKLTRVIGLVPLPEGSRVVDFGASQAFGDYRTTLSRLKTRVTR
jgi:hypothetical protein